MDWNRIRKDYIAGKGSYRDLAKKYNVPLKTLARQAKSENWFELRKQSWNKAATKAADAVANASSRVDTSLQAAAAALAEKALEGIQNIDPAEARSLKAYSGVLRDLKEVLNIRPELDIQEQQARIEKLRREAQEAREDKTRDVSVTFGGAEEWAE